ncbi:MAG: hypothetical protein AAGJ18_26980, partial [Bacteroidota bacterium]
QMEALLNSLPVGDTDAIDAHFDAQVKHKLTQITPIANEAVWDNISSALSDAEAKDAQFDQLFSEKLTAIKPSAVADWGQLESKLILEEGQDIAFDQEVANKLQGLQKPVASSHWQKMVERLNSDFAVRDKLYRYKLWEVTLMILLLLNFYQYFPADYSELPVVQVLKKQKAKAADSLNRMVEVLVPNRVITTEANVDKELAKIAEKRENKTERNPKLIIQDDEPKDSGNSEVLKVANTLSREQSTETPINRKIVGLVNPLRSSVPTTFDFKNGLTISVSEMNQHLTLYANTNKDIIGTVPSLTPNFVESQYIAPLGCKDCKYNKVPAKLRLGVIASLAVNNAYLSGGEILDINAFNERGVGYGGGYGMGFKYGRWEIETGLLYNAKRYDPSIIERQGTNRRTHFKTIHLQTLQIPANFRFNYAVMGKGRWHLYAQTGAALNVILRAEYDLAEIASNSRSLANAVTTARLRQIDFNNGLLAGDGFQNNRFLSISLGTGVERYISPNLSLFIQPDFHFHFSGNRIGPTQDRINTLSLSFGARKSL